MKPSKITGNSRRVALLVTALLGSSLGGPGAAVLLEGCGSTTTGGHRVVLQTRLTLDADTGAAFTTGAGWRVSLTRALLATGAFYYFDGAPPLVVRRTARDWELAQRWLGLNTAHAHPGHYQAGDALGQMLVPWSVDLLGGSVALADGEGVTGTYRSARFSFNAPALGPVRDALGAHAALAEGTASKDGEDTRTFRAFADLAEIEKSAAEGRVDGCEFLETDVESDGVVTVRVLPKVWFNLVDFAQLAPGSLDVPTEFEPDSQPKIAFAQGVAQLSAYKFSYSKP